MSGRGRLWHVVDTTGAVPALVAVRSGPGGGEVVDRVVFLTPEEAKVAAAPATDAVAAARLRLADRGVGSTERLLWLMSQPGAGPAELDPVAIPAAAAVALGAEAADGRQRRGGAGQGDALHLGFGSVAGLVRSEGRVAVDRDGWPLRPRALASSLAFEVGGLAGGSWSPLDAESVLAAWCREVPATTVEPLWPLQALGYPARRISEGDVVATAMALASRRALGLWIGELLSLWDIAAITLHLGDRCLATWLGLPASDGEGRGSGAFDGATLGALGALGDAVASHSFASIRRATTLSWRVVDADTAAIGAVCWAQR